jgi:hypothetical protein
LSFFGWNRQFRYADRIQASQLGKGLDAFIVQPVTLNTIFALPESALLPGVRATAHD